MVYLGDLRVKAALILGLEDITKNLWLIDDILGDTVSNEYMRRLYGSQISSCKQWITNNRINILMSLREDKVEFPAIVVELGSNDEKMDMRHMADLSTEKVTLYPNDINKPIPFVLKPISGGTYNSVTGVFSFNADVNLNAVAPEMVLVDPATGTGFVIQSVTTANQVNLLPGLTFTPALYGIIPHFQTYQARVGHTFMQENYKISCHAMDQQTLLWLHTITVYVLLRYRQKLLEAGGGTESVLKSTGMYPNPDYSDSGQVIWSRDVNLSLQTESRWIEQPHRYIENLSLGNADGFTGGLKILSNITDSQEDLSTVNWSTLQDLAYADED
jgi:hypothetical protein